MAWIKKGTSGTFDLTMGSYSGVEMCILVGIYILHELADRIKKEDTGLYCDNGLILPQRHTGKQTDKARKDITKISKNIGFSSEIKMNLRVVNFLNVTFDLTRSS